MMIPQVARRIIHNYGKNCSILFDPYCGTGTSLVEANLKGLSAIGTDLNPLARLIAIAKTTRIDLQVLDLFLHDFTNFIFSINFNISNTNSLLIPDVKNIDFWFSKKIQNKLGLLLSYLENIHDMQIRNFFKVALSETIRETSNTKNGEFKLVRSKDYENKDDADVFAIFNQKLLRNKLGLKMFQEKIQNEPTTNIYDFNSVHNIPESIVKPESIDIVVTSPPYGDSRTTVAYGQYSRLSNEWLGFLNANQIDNKLMGGVKRKHDHTFNSQILNDVISAIQLQDRERARDVISFYEDYENSINNVALTIKRNGFACYVVGNRTVKGINIPTDKITAELFISNGFDHIDTIIRNIPNKRMPLKNSPTNIPGKTGATMKHEYIVICRKR